MAPSPVQLDFSKAVPINTPAQPQPQSAPVTLDFNQSQPIAPPSAPAPQTTQPQPTPPVATVSATPGSDPNDPLAAKVALWAQNVQSDLMHGTDITGVGHVLKALGAHGLASGTSEDTARFMGSLPLGLLRVIQGGAEGMQHGQRWQGTKDVVGGALDAATIPGSFVAPEAGEVGDVALGKAGDALLTQASKAAKAIREPFSLKALQPKVQGAITAAITDAAREHGVTIPSSANVRDVAQILSDAVRSKARQIYQQLDTALGTGQRWQSFQDQIDNIDRAIREGMGIDPERDTALAKRLETVGAARDAAMADIRAKGLDPDNLLSQADRLHRQSMALSDFSRAVRASTDVHPSVANEPLGSPAAQRLEQAITGKPAAKNVPANVRTAPFFKRIQQLATPNPKYPGTPSRLIQALGEQRAEALLNAVDAAHLASQKIIARNQWLKRGATALGIYGLGREVFHGAHSLLSDGQ